MSVASLRFVRLPADSIPWWFRTSSLLSQRRIASWYRKSVICPNARHGQNSCRTCPKKPSGITATILQSPLPDNNWLTSSALTGVPCQMNCARCGMKGFCCLRKMNLPCYKNTLLTANPVKRAHTLRNILFSQHVS